MMTCEIRYRVQDREALLICDRLAKTADLTAELTQENDMYQLTLTPHAPVELV